MLFKLRRDVTTVVPTHLLIEDHNTLLRAIREQDWSLVSTVMDCLAETIDHGTVVPPDIKIKPSPSTPICPEHAPGIILDADNCDITCILGKPMSEVLSGGVCQCYEDCTERLAGNCDPDNGMICMRSIIPYNLGSPDNDVLKSLLPDQVQ